MGNYIIEVKGVGGHGCQRNVGDGKNVEVECDRADTCPDCIARAFVQRLQETNNLGHDASATLTHWPNTESEVKDDLLTLERTGSFGS